MSELIYLRGTPKELRPVLIQLMANYQLLQNLEIDSSSSINENFDPNRKYHPLIRLFFKQDSTFVAGTNQPKGQGRNRKEGELSFRLMDETTETLSKNNLISLGQKIKAAFGENEGYLWHKGKELYCYADWSRGYQLQMLARTESQARELVTKILALQNHTPTWRYLTKSESVVESEKYPATTEVKTILGEQVTLPLRRPNVEVRFRHAEAQVSPLAKPVIVYDRTGKKAGALVK